MCSRDNKENFEIIMCEGHKIFLSSRCHMNDSLFWAHLHNEGRKNSERMSYRRRERGGGGMRGYSVNTDLRKKRTCRVYTRIYIHSGEHTYSRVKKKRRKK